jgi:uncharacterized protein
MYRNGFGVPKDFEAAKKMYDKAARRGDSPSMLQLGRMYWRGDGLKVDKVAAYSWMLSAYSCRDPNAAEDATLLEKDMSEKEIRKAKQKTTEFLMTRPCAHPRIPAVQRRP